MLARAVMRRDVVTVSPNATISEIAGLMAGENVGAGVVMDEDLPIGIVTDQDLVRRLLVIEAGKLTGILSASNLIARFRDAIDSLFAEAGKDAH